jgi:hypothetical protein
MFSASTATSYTSFYMFSCCAQYVCNLWRSGGQAGSLCTPSSTERSYQVEKRLVVPRFVNTFTVLFSASFFTHLSPLARGLSPLSTPPITYTYLRKRRKLVNKEQAA